MVTSLGQVARAGPDPRVRPDPLIFENSSTVPFPVRFVKRSLRPGPKCDWAAIVN